MNPACTKLLLAVSVATSAMASANPSLGNPVCGVHDGNRATYASEAAAQRADARVLHSSGCEAPGKEPMMCSMLFKPVCASDAATSGEKTYPNLCHAEVANAKVLHDGQCAANKS